MNFIEAIRTEKPLRRKGKPSHVGSSGTGWVDPWCFLGCHSAAISAAYGVKCPVPHLSLEDVLADDWEVQEKSIELTRSHFYQIASKVVKRFAERDGLRFMGPDGIVNGPISVTDFHGWKELADELGL
jgi:hypothetical protein